MSRIFDCHQQGDAWIAARVGRITGSSVPKLLLPPTTRASTRSGVNCPAGTVAAALVEYQHNLVLERLYGVMTQQYVTSYMKNGSEQEEYARRLYEALMELDEPVQLIGFALHPVWDWFGCSPDGLVGDKGGLELKCPGEASHDAYIQNPNTLVEEYKGQVLANLLCFPEREWWDLCSFNPHAYRDDLKMIFAPRFHRSDWTMQMAEIEDKAEKFNNEIEAEIAKRGLPPTQWCIMPKTEMKG